MKKTTLLLIVLATTGVAQANVVDLLSDNFDSYLDASEVSTMWTGSFSELSTTESYSAPQSIYNSGIGANSISATFAPTVGTDVNPIEFSFMFNDINGTGNLRQFSSIRDASPSLTQLLAIGVYGSGMDYRTGLAATVAQINTYYLARVAFGTDAPAWFILNGDGAPTRSAGWHEMAIVIKDQKLDFLIDGVSAIQGIAPVQDYNLPAGLTFDTVVVGSGLSSANGGAYYDDVKVQILPEPVSLLLLALGAVFVHRRRA